MTPTFTVTDDGPYATVTIANPVPTGSEPAAASNQLFRRVQGETDWARIATGIEVDGFHLDWNLGGGQPYEYYVRAYSTTGSFADSDLGEFTHPLEGVALHSVLDPAGTFRQFLYRGDFSSEAVGADTDLLRFAGRTYPVAEFGEGEDRRVHTAVLVPYGSSHSEDLRRLREFVRSRTLTTYRDGRGRVLFGILDELSLQDTEVGVVASFTVQRTDHDEAV